MEINRELAGRALDRIIANPWEWSQDSFCGSTFCYAGNVLLIEGYVPGRCNFVNDEGVDVASEVAAAEHLGLDGDEAGRIFYFFPDCELEDRGIEPTKGNQLRLMIERVAEVTGIDPAPYLAKVADLP